MEKSADTIGKRKYSSMSSRRQHQLLASLVKNAIKTGDVEHFRKRYQELHSWSELDRYIPPPWLSKEELLEEYFVFHSNFSSVSEELAAADSSISWNPEFPVEVVLDQVRSPYNVGSVLRLIDNFTCMGVVHSTSWLRLDHPQLRKSARGCEKWIPVRYEPDLVPYLKNAPVPVIAIEDDKKGVPINQWAPPRECILVLGNETYGIASAIRKCCDKSVFIPMFGFKKSMNLHHALAIVLQKITEKHKTGFVS